jgi:molybdopterin converting factor small subunit
MTSGPGATRSDSDVTIRYWASARAAAGCDSERFTAHHVGDVLEAAAAAHPGLGAVLAVSSILLDGRPVARAGTLPESSPESLSESLSESLPELLPELLYEGAVLEVLPPFAGG